jgi:hypothetical protein
MGEGTLVRTALFGRQGTWYRRAADPGNIVTDTSEEAPPVPPPPVVRDEADSVDSGRLMAQRSLAAVRGFRRAFLSPRGPGGPDWQAPETPAAVGAHTTTPTQAGGIAPPRTNLPTGTRRGGAGARTQ